MQFGICINLVQELRDGSLEEKLGLIAKNGYAYVETSASSCEDMTAEECEAITSLLRKANIPCTRSNVLFPGSLKIVGPEADERKIRAYLEALMPKLSALGVTVAVLGSGGARNVPEGTSLEEGFQQFCNCAKLASEIGKASGVKIALEHLNPKETNLLTTVKEAVDALKAVNLPGCGLLFDYYHVDMATKDIDSVLEAGGKLLHSHIAVPVTRKYPMMRDEDVIRPYFEILKKAGYDGTISVEAGPDEALSYAENLAATYRFLEAFNHYGKSKE